MIRSHQKLIFGQILTVKKKIRVDTTFDIQYGHMKKIRSTDLQTNPFPPLSLTHPLLPRKHTLHLTPETPPLSVP